MVPQFKSMSEVMSYVKETMILDVSELISPLNIPEVLEALHPPKPGIYLKTDGTCIHQFRHEDPIYDLAQFTELNKNTPLPSIYALKAMSYHQRRYFENMQFNRPAPLTALDQVLRADGVCDHKGEILSRLSRLKRVQHHLTDTPSYTRQLAAFARIMICRILAQECPYVRIGLLDNTTHIVKHHYLSVFDDGMFDSLFTHVRMSIRRLIGEDVFSIYTLKDMQHHILISKSMDYRIFEYYQMKFGQDDE